MSLPALTLPSSVGPLGSSTSQSPVPGKPRLGGSGSPRQSPLQLSPSFWPYRVPGIPEHLYMAAQGQGVMHSPFPVSSPEQMALYPSLASLYAGGPEKLGAGMPLHPGLAMDPAAMAAYAAYGPAGYSPYDMGGARRKNATRETTSTLKAWLHEHRKNPYPTKGEKIMLAIITKMTLTQVSTWFANARRRLKKENKMTWEPRNRGDEDDDDDDDNDADEDRKNGSVEGSESRLRDDPIDEDGEEEKLDVVDDDSSLPAAKDSTAKDSSIADSDKERKSPKSEKDLAISSRNQSSSPCHSKPKIWSIADVATSKSSAVTERNSSRSPNSSSSSFITPSSLPNVSPLSPGLPHPAVLKVGQWLNGSFPYPIPMGLPPMGFHHAALPYQFMAAQRHRSKLEAAGKL